MFLSVQDAGRVFASRRARTFPCLADGRIFPLFLRKMQPQNRGAPALRPLGAAAGERTLGNFRPRSGEACGASDEIGNCRDVVQVEDGQGALRNRMIGGDGRDARIG